MSEVFFCLGLVFLGGKWGLRKNNLQLKNPTYFNESKAFLGYFKCTKKQGGHYIELGILKQSLRGDL